MARRPLNVFSSTGDSIPHAVERRELLKLWARDRWAFLTGKDVDGAPLIVTQDELDEVHPHKPFPTDKPHLKALSDELFGPQQVTLVDKSRQMMVSTLCVLLLYWTILFHRGRLCFISKQTQDLAEVLLRDKMRGVHLRTPDWFQDVMRLTMEPKDGAEALYTGSRVQCVAQNAAVRAFKGNTASIILIDEAAVQEYFADMLQAAKPMAKRIWAITTAYHGNPGAETFYRLKMEA